MAPMHNSRSDWADCGCDIRLRNWGGMFASSAACCACWHKVALLILKWMFSHLRAIVGNSDVRPSKDWMAGSPSRSSRIPA